MNESMRTIINRHPILFLIVFLLLISSLIVINRRIATPSLHQSIIQNNTTTKVTIPNRIYMSSTAYLIDWRTIQFTSIRQCNQSLRHNHLSIRTSINSIQPHYRVTSSLISSSCPWWYQQQCRLVGYFITFRFDANISSSDYVTIANGAHQSISLPLHHHHHHRRHHRLAICLQPVFLFADWTLMVQFFEYWIVAGATKFYFYMQSIAPEIDQILSVYRMDRRNIEIEMIDWSYLPDDNDGLNNPNNYIYRTEVVTAINDCIMRSRIAGDHYMASVDFDEMIVPIKNQTILPLLDRYQQKHSNIGAFVFRSANAHFVASNNTNDDPSTINFDYLSTIELETKIWPIGSRSKWIIRPERVRRCHVHSIIDMDHRRFAILNVDPRIAIVVHTRRVRDRSPKTIAKPSRLLESYVAPMNAGLRRRHSTGKIINRGAVVMNELERCLLDDFAQRERICNSPYRCRHRLATSIGDTEWILANLSWIVF